MSQAIPKSCRRCERGPLVHGSRWRGLTKSERKATGGVEHCARGLCRACYESVLGQDALYDYEPVSRNSEEILEEWALLRSDGMTDLTIAAERIGTTRAALEKCLERARKAGDPRGQVYRNGQLGGIRQGSMAGRAA